MGDKTGLFPAKKDIAGDGGQECQENKKFFPFDLHKS